MPIYILNREIMGIEADDWNDPSTLDALLLTRNMMRSNAGFVAGDSIITTEIVKDDIKYLEEISAALALQRAMIATMTCESQKPDIVTIMKTTARVESRGETHEALLREEVVRASKQCPLIMPPEMVFTYEDDAVIKMLRRSLHAVKGGTYGVEATGVANSLCLSGNLLENLDPLRFNEMREAQGADLQSPNLPRNIRNNLAWLSRNITADADMTSRYLQAYGTDIEDLLSQIETLEA